MPVSNPFRDYENQWVGLSRDYKQVLLSAKTLNGLTQKIKKSKMVKKIVITKVYPFSTIISP